VPRFALATAAGYAAWTTRSIWASVGLHAAYNLSLFVGGAALPALLPAPPRAEAWADTDRAAFFFWANDPRVFWPALVVSSRPPRASMIALRRLADVARAFPRGRRRRRLSVTRPPRVAVSRAPAPPPPSLRPLSCASPVAALA
jgi:hypothetical protein